MFREPFALQGSLQVIGCIIKHQLARDIAWRGWREFHVVRREYEDPSQSQCSFYRQAVDGQPLPIFKPGQFLTFSLDLPGVESDGAALALEACRLLPFVTDRQDASRDQGKPFAVPCNQRVETSNARPRQVVTARQGSPRQLRALPHRKRLQQVHLLRLP